MIITSTPLLYAEAGQSISQFTEQACICMQLHTMERCILHFNSWLYILRGADITHDTRQKLIDDYFHYTHINNRGSW